jgi:hypothetical protein
MFVYLLIFVFLVLLYGAVSAFFGGKDPHDAASTADDFDTIGDAFAHSRVGGPQHNDMVDRPIDFGFDDD